MGIAKNTRFTTPKAMAGALCNPFGQGRRRAPSSYQTFSDVHQSKALDKNSNSSQRLDLSHPRYVYK